WKYIQPKNSSQRLCPKGTCDGSTRRTTISATVAPRKTEVAFLPSISLLIHFGAMIEATPAAPTTGIPSRIATSATAEGPKTLHVAAGAAFGISQDSQGQYQK